MADEEIKTSEERKCFGMKEKDVLSFVIPCAAAFVGTLLAIAVYNSLTLKPAFGNNCPPPCYYSHNYYDGPQQFHHKKFKKEDAKQTKSDKSERPFDPGFEQD